MSIMKNSAADSGAMKQMKSSEANKVTIMSVLCLITLGANIAYSAVGIIFPNKVTEHGLSGIYTAVIIAGYPFA